MLGVDLRTLTPSCLARSFAQRYQGLKERNKRSDMTPPENNICPNCSQDFSTDKSYCSNCGQKIITKPPTVRELLAEFLNSIFNLDSKIFRTLRSLFVPGKLTIEYFNGKRKSYINPVRLFFIIAVFFFAVTNFSGFYNVEEQFKIGTKSFLLDVKEEEIMAEVDSVVQLHSDRIEDSVILLAIDTLRKDLQMLDNDKNNMAFRILGPVKNKNRIPIELERQDIFNLTEAEIIKKYQVVHIYDRILLRQLLKYYNDGESFARYLFGSLIWTVFLMMVVYAFILKMVFSRDKKYYVEHLIFALNEGSFGLLIISLIVFMVTLSIFPALGLLLVLPIYSFIAMKRFYGLNNEQTFGNYCLVAVLSVIVFLILLTGTFFLSFFLF